LRNRGANAAVILVDGPSSIVKISPSKLLTSLSTSLTFNFFAWCVIIGVRLVGRCLLRALVAAPG
jgi:hypothetical protein